MARFEDIFEDVFKEIASAALADRGAPHPLKAGARTAPDHRNKQVATVLRSERIRLMRASLKGRFSKGHECTRHRVHSTTETTKEPRVRDSGSHN